MPVAGDDQRPQRGAVREPACRRRAARAISSGLIALNESGRSRVRVPISPSTSRRIVFSSGGVVVGSSRCSVRRRYLPAGAEPNLGGVADIDTAAQGAARSAGRLPVQGREGQGPLRGQGDLDPQAGRRRTSRASRRSATSPARWRSIDFLVTETEAEALLAEQQFIKRHRPRFNIRLRDDKSYPYIGITLDEEFPRVYFTRERHRSGRLYFGPYSNAKRTRETLDLLGKLFQYRTCDGPEPGRRSGVPCLDYYIKRCQAPCVGYIDREEYRRNIEAIASFLSGRYRDVERDVERKMKEAAEAEEFERAAIYRDRLDAVRSLMQRRSDRLRLARERRPDRRRRRGRRRERAGLPGPRRDPRRAPRLLPRERGRARGGGGDGGVPRPVLRGGALGARG